MLVLSHVVESTRTVLRHSRCHASRQRAVSTLFNVVMSRLFQKRETMSHVGVPESVVRLQ